MAVPKDSLDEGPEVRGHWKRSIEFILSLVGFSIGMGNIWRFPYLAMRNGGGAFLIPYVVFAFVIGIPVVFMEIAFGQYFQLSPLLIFDMCPLFKGLGVAITLLAFIGYIYAMTVLAWTLYYLAMSFQPVLPWTTCGNPWNTNSCVPISPEASQGLANKTVMSNWTGEASVLSNWTGKASVLATEEFWNYNVLDISPGIDSPGNIRWQLLLALIVAFGMVYICIFKGIESSRIAVYLTATAPFVLLVVFLVWLLTQPGSVEGIVFYITPRWDQITKFKTWLEAFLQLFYSLGSGWGGLINLASYNNFHNNCVRDSLIVVIADTLTAILCGAVVFAGVGCLAYQTNTHVADVISTGPGLSFITYPQVVSLFPIPHFWAICFFLLTLFLGLDSQFALVKTLTSGLTDLYPGSLGRRKPLVVFVVLILSLLLALPFITRGGMYAFHIVDWYATFFTISVVVFLETIAIAWLYGCDQFMANIKEMGPFAPSWYLKCMKISWKFLVPFCMLAILVIAMVKFRSPTYGDYVYPEWTNVLGWILALCSSLPIPILMIRQLLKAEGTILQRLRFTIRPKIGQRGSVKTDYELEHLDGYRKPIEETAMMPLSKEC